MKKRLLAAILCLVLCLTLAPLSAFADASVTYTVSFDANGGSKTMESVTVSDSTYTLPASGFKAPSTAYYFGGWALSADGDPIYAETITLTGDTTLYAIWEENGRIIDKTDVIYDNSNDTYETVYMLDGNVIDDPGDAGYLDADGKPCDKAAAVWRVSVIDYGEYTLKTKGEDVLLGKTTLLVSIQYIAIFNGSLVIGDGVMHQYSVVRRENHYEVTETYQTNDTYERTATVYVESAAEPYDPCEGYTDINRSQWYHTAADYVIENGLMGSTKTDKLTFEPNAKVTRAMVATILYAMVSKPEVEYKGTFADVPASAWYAAPIEWCAQNGLASGKGAGIFDPNGNVTRQELAVFMMQMANYLGKDTSGKAELSGFADAATVPSWAKTFIEWAVDAGVISGKASGDKTYLAATANATRAEFAAIIRSFVLNIAEAK